MVAFEAAVAGGIPIIKALREGLTANRIEWIAGIINGTTNFILSEMRDKGLPFEPCSRTRSAWAMPRPIRPSISKASMPRTRSPLLAAIAFGIPMQFDKAHIEGISKLTPTTSSTPKRSAIASSCWASPRKADGVELRVHPTLIPAKRLIANVEGAMNAVLVQGRRRGRHALLRQGRRRRADRQFGDRRSGRRDALHTADPEHRVPHLAFQPISPTRRSCRSAKSSPLLPAPARARTTRRAGRHHAHPGRPADLDRCHDAARTVAKASRRPTSSC
jgi:homoserine dehydrogenase